MIDKLDGNTSKRTKLKELCRTRWVERHDAFEVFIDFFPAILESIEHYSHLPNTRTPGAADASSLYNSVTRFDFIISLVIVYKCLAYVSGLSKSLQQRSLDIGRAFQHWLNHVLRIHEMKLRSFILIALSRLLNYHRP